MAGSLSHIVGRDGRFRMDLIENMGDAHEALEECYDIIFDLSGGDTGIISAACRRLRFPDPWEICFDEPLRPPMQISQTSALKYINTSVEGRPMRIELNPRYKPKAEDTQ